MTNRALRKQAVAVFALVCLTMLLSLTASAAAKKVTFWYWPWGGMGKAAERMGAIFESKYGIKVESSPNSNLDKVLVNVAAGVPPDVIATGGGHMSTFIPKGVIMPLDDLIESTPTVRNGLVPPAWQGLEVEGQVWYVPGLEWGPRDGLAYNKTFFAESGLSELDPSVPPKWDEIAKLNRKLVRVTDNRITRIGYMPIEGRNFTLDLLEWAFDVKFWNPTTKEVQVNSPSIREAVTFLHDNFIASWGMDAIRSGFGGDPAAWYTIALGKTSMANLGYYAPLQLKTRSKDQWEFGYTWHPTLSGKRVTGLSGWGLAMPTGAQVSEAWSLISYIATDLEAGRILFEEVGQFPASRAFFATFRPQDPGYRWYVEAVGASEWEAVDDGRPSYAFGVVNKHLKAAAMQTFTGQMAAPAALDAAQVLVEAELDELTRQ